MVNHFSGDFGNPKSPLLLELLATGKISCRFQVRWGHAKNKKVMRPRDGLLRRYEVFLIEQQQTPQERRARFLHIAGETDRSEKRAETSDARERYLRMAKSWRGSRNSGSVKA
jgi:hypothetical protein